LTLDAPWKILLVLVALGAVRLALWANGGSRKHWRQSLAEFIDSAIIALALVFLVIRPFVIQSFYIPSGSMENTLLKGDRILVNKFIYHFEEPRPKDVVVFRAPPAASAEPRDFIKRLVGVPGDHIKIECGVLYRNGVPQDEPYIKEPPIQDFPTPEMYAAGGVYTLTAETYEPTQIYVDKDGLYVPPGYLWMLGDNRNGSHDGRKWGYTPRENVIGKAMFIFWPPHRIGFVR